MEDERLVKMNEIPVVRVNERDPLVSKQCYGCGRGAIHHFIFRVSPARTQAISWCSSCLRDVADYLSQMSYGGGE